MIELNPPDKTPKPRPLKEQATLSTKPENPATLQRN